MISRLLLAGLVASLVLGQALEAATLEEEYQSALMAEKGKGDLKEAIRLYKKVVEQAPPEGEGVALAARAQIRIGICEEKLGLKKAREAYQKVAEEFSDQPQVVMEAAKHIQDVRQLELKIDTVGQIREGQQPELMAPVEPYRTTSTSWHDRLERFSQNVTNQAMTIVRGLHMPGQKGRRYTSYAYRQPVIPYEYQRVAEVPIDWKFLLDLEDFDPPGVVKGKDYSQAGYDDSQWADIQIGQAWEDQGYDRYDLGAWYRAEIEVEVKDDEAPVYMGFGGVDLHGYVYLNGELVGAHHVWDQPFILDISEGVNRHGKNTVTIFVYDGAGMGGIYGTIDIHQPIGETSLNQFIANRGGSVHNYATRYKTPTIFVHAGTTYQESIPHENFSGVGGSTQYASYAGAAPHIPYAHRVVAAVPDQWKFNIDYGTLTAKQYAQYPKADYDDSNWPQIRIGQAWEDQGLPGYDEAAWYRATVEVDAGGTISWSTWPLAGWIRTRGFTSTGSWWVNTTSGTGLSLLISAMP
jgi:tetratricopeptide (TPR) repeat protein